MNIPHFKIEKGKVTDAHVKEHMKEIAPSIGEEDFRLTSIKDSPAIVDSDPADDQVLAFLKDIQQYPDSGIANRYKRLSVSVRQGQKLKARALQAELVTGRLEHTETGRLSIIKVTSEGESLLNKYKK